jgi:hypothetical protein
MEAPLLNPAFRLAALRDSILTPVKFGVASLLCTVLFPGHAAKSHPATVARLSALHPVAICHVQEWSCAIQPSEENLMKSIRNIALAVAAGSLLAAGAAAASTTTPEPRRGRALPGPIIGFHLCAPGVAVAWRLARRRSRIDAGQRAVPDGR